VRRFFKVKLAEFKGLQGNTLVMATEVININLKNYQLVIQVFTHTDLRIKELRF
jgi:hypothetical protein